MKHSHSICTGYGLRSNHISSALVLFSLTNISRCLFYKYNFTYLHIRKLLICCNVRGILEENPFGYDVHFTYLRLKLFVLNEIIRFVNKLTIKSNVMNRGIKLFVNRNYDLYILKHFFRLHLGYVIYSENSLFDRKF